MKLKLVTLSIILSSIFAVTAYSHFDHEANDVNTYTWDPDPAKMHSLQFVNIIADKKEVTFGETVRFFMLTVHGHFLDFERDLDFLVRNNIAQGIKLKESDIVDMGTLSLMCARALKLNNSLFYKIFKNKRYAMLLCAGAGIISENSGARDKVSGEELIEIMRKLEQIQEGYSI